MKNALRICVKRSIQRHVILVKEHWDHFVFSSIDEEVQWQYSFKPYRVEPGANTPIIVTRHFVDTTIRAIDNSTLTTVRRRNSPFLFSYSLNNLCLCQVDSNKCTRTETTRTYKSHTHTRTHACMPTAYNSLPLSLSLTLSVTHFVERQFVNELINEQTTPVCLSTMCRLYICWCRQTDDSMICVFDELYYRRLCSFIELSFRRVVMDSPRILQVDSVCRMMYIDTFAHAIWPVLTSDNNHVITLTEMTIARMSKPKTIFNSGKAFEITMSAYMSY